MLFWSRLYTYNNTLYFNCTYVLLLLFILPQQAQQGMEKAVKQLASASDEQSKAEAQIAVDFNEALMQSVKA